MILPTRYIVGWKMQLEIKNPKDSNMVTYQQIKALIADTDGATVDRFGNLPTRRFLASPYKHAEKRFQFDLTAPEFSRWAKVHSHLLSRPDHYIGVWKHQGTTYLDVVVETDSKEVAIRICRDNRQLAYFDRIKGESVYV